MSYMTSLPITLPAKGHKDEVCPQENTLHFVLKCTEYHKYVKFLMQMKKTKRSRFTMVRSVIDTPR